VPPARTPPKHKPVPEAASDERPTLIPDFSPEDFARNSEMLQQAAARDAQEPTVDEARALHLEGEHERALFLLARLLELAPVHPQAIRLMRECRAALEQQCLAAVGSERAVLVGAVSAQELKRFTLDSVSGFLLSLIDGVTPVGDILDIAYLPRLLALRHLRNLVDRGIVCVASGKKRSIKPERPSVPCWYGPLEGESDAALQSGIQAMHVGTPTPYAVAVLLLAPGQVDTLGLDSQARTVVALVNDERTVGQILVSANLDLARGVELFKKLAEQGIVAFA